jgi:DNA-binding transcriptional MocR family regulator
MASNMTGTASLQGQDERALTAPATINLSGNLPPKIPHVFDDLYRSAVTAVIAERAPSGLIAAHSFRGAPRDREAGTKFLTRRLPEPPSADRVVITSGTQAALTMLMTGLVKPGGLLAVEELSYPTIRQFASMLGIRLCSVTMDGEGALPEAYESVCRLHRPAAFYVLPTLHNPTTATMSLPRRQAIADISRKHDVKIIEDDIYSLLPRDLPPPLAALAPDISWYILGTAKSIAPGLKVAYLVAPNASEAESRFWPGVRATYWNCAPINAAVATVLIEGSGADQIIDEVRLETRARQRLVSEYLPDIAKRASPDGLHVWLELPSSLPRAEFAARTRASGVEIGTSDTFFFGQGEPPNALRFGTGTAASRKDLEQALGAIARTYKVIG